MSEKKLYHYEPWLREKYHTEGKSQKEIAEEVGVTPGSIEYWMEKYGIEARSKKTLEIPEGWLEEVYWEDELSQAEIAEISGATRTAISKKMKECGIETRRSPVEIDEEWLREKYHQEKLMQEEVAEEAGCSQITISRKMREYEIERRPGSVNPSNFHPTFYTDVRGYEKVATTEGHTSVHRLVAVAEFGMEEIKDKQIHHKNGIPWDNRLDNLVALTRSEHAREHGLGTEIRPD